MTPPAVRAPWDDAGVSRQPNPEDLFLAAAEGPLLDLRESLLELGYSIRVVNGCIGFVMAARSGKGLTTSEQQRALYRRMLREVCSPATFPGLWALWPDGHAA